MKEPRRRGAGGTETDPGEAVTPLVLAYNEEENIGRLLDSLRWARRVVVLDSGSDDATREIAARYANVSWRVNPFESFRQQTLRGLRATEIDTEYVLALDADMAVPAALVDEVSACFLGRGYAGGLLGFDYRYGGRSLLGSVYPAQVRLFRRTEVEVQQEGHGHTMRVAGRVYRFRNRLLHDDRKPLERWVSSQLGYSRAERDRLRRAPSLRLRDWLRRAALMPPASFLAGYLAAGGPLAGRRALRYAYERATYEALLALRILRDRDAESP